MTDPEREILENAWAQATGAQAILQALLIMMDKTGTSREFLEKVFDLAAQPSEILAMKQDRMVSAHAVRTLQVVDHFRMSVLGKSDPK